MTCKEFNEKYAAYLEKGHYGCDIYNEKAIDYLDKEFEELSKDPNFSFFQIKSKFNFFRVYCNESVSVAKQQEMENNLLKIYNNEKI